VFVVLYVFSHWPLGFITHCFRCWPNSGSVDALVTQTYGDLSFFGSTTIIFQSSDNVGGIIYLRVNNSIYSQPNSRIHSSSLWSTISFDQLTVDATIVDVVGPVVPCPADPSKYCPSMGSLPTNAFTWSSVAVRQPFTFSISEENDATILNCDRFCSPGLTLKSPSNADGKSVSKLALYL
jgi:hypothetical protein